MPNKTKFSWAKGVCVTYQNNNNINNNSGTVLNGKISAMGLKLCCVVNVGINF